MAPLSATRVTARLIQFSTVVLVTLTASVAGPAPTAGAARAVAAPPRYMVTDLGSLDGNSSANAINNSGEVVGGFGPRFVHAVVWRNGVASALAEPPGVLATAALAVNDAGQIAGDVPEATALRWVDGRLQNLGDGVARAIDQSGRAIGIKNDHAVRWDQAGNATDLLATRPFSLGAGANGVNARGQIVGGAAVDTPSGAFLWQNGVTTGLPALAGGGFAVASAINVAGQIVGYSGKGTDTANHAVLWERGRVTELGRLDGAVLNSATGINAAGQVVGTAAGAPSFDQRAFLWTRRGGLVALNDLIPQGLSWDLMAANGINDRGEIVGFGLHAGQIRAFRLTPAFHANINFQPAGAAVPAGYVPDTGAPFGARNGLTYGWNVDNSAHARERNAASSPDQRYDTLTHLQKPGGGTVWGLSVPNGAYSVHAVAGDPSAADSVFRLNVEGVPAVSGTPTNGDRWIEATVRVTVADGVLTITNAPGASNNKMSYLDIVSD